MFISNQRQMIRLVVSINRLVLQMDGGKQRYILFKKMLKKILTALNSLSSCTS